jgi:NRPS condensation-like uncharacterized protein
VKKTTNSRNTKCFPSSIKDECFYAWGSMVNQAPLMYYGLLLKGRLDHGAMKSALHETLEIHGKLGCVITRQASSWKRWFRLVWEPRDPASSDILRFLTASEHGIELNREAHYYRNLILKHSMDVSKEPGVRIVLITKDEENLLFFAFHHAPTDARGALNFIETFISEYNEIYFNKKTASREARRKHTHPGKSFWWQCLDVVRSFVYILQHQYRALRKPLIKVSPKTQEPDSKEALVVARKIEREEFEKILALAKKKSIRFVDLLLAGIYLAVRKWNSRCGDDESGRISFFASVGVLQGDPKAVGNITAGMIVNLLSKDTTDKEQLLTNITKARGAFLKYGDIYGFLSIFKLMPIRFRLRALKRVFERMRFKHNRRFPTMRIANLGMLDVSNFSQDDRAILGDAKLQDIILSPANVNEVPWLVFHTYNKNLYVYFAVLKSAFSQESGAEFLALLFHELLEF